MSWKVVKLGELIENFSVKAKDFDVDVSTLDFLGVSNTDGITKSKYAAEDKADDYKIMVKGCFAYNPYRINVGSIAMLEDDIIGLISPAYVVFKVKEKTIIPELLLKFLKSTEGLRQIKLHARGTVRQALRFSDLCKIEISLPDYEEQLEFYKSISNTEAHSNILSTELTHQLDLVKKLRQSFLREAMQGKLTAEWRKQNQNDEPATELLAKIKTEKEQLIKEKKIKKQKPLPPIIKEEIPFEIPDNWVWCRLGDITTYGSSQKADPNKFNKDTWVLDLEDIEKETSKLLNKVRFDERNSLSTKSVFEYGDVLYSKLRPYLDKVIVADENGVCTTEILPLKCFANTNPYFFRYALKRPDFISFVNSVTKGMKMPRLGTEEGRKALIPLPPLSEQKAIVEKLDKLMAYCDSLEESIKNSQSQNKMLLQQVLREALEPKSEIIKEEVKL